MNKVSHTILPPPAHSRRAARALKLLPIAALLAAGAAQAQVTSFEITGFQNTGSTCGDVQALVNIGGSSGAPTCVKYTIVQGSKTAELVEDPGIPAGKTEQAPFNGLTADPIDAFDPNQPFTLTWSAGDGGSSPACDTWGGTLQVSGCIAPITFKTFYTVTATATDGTISCTPDPVLEGDTVECSATANPGSVLETLEISDGVNPPASCTTSPCSLAGVKGKVTAKATFKAESGGDTGGGGGGAGGGAGTGGGGDSSSPTMGELGLLLSGLALAGAAAPALRRREKQGKKTDTCQ